MKKVLLLLLFIGGGLITNQAFGKLPSKTEIKEEIIGSVFIKMRQLSLYQKHQVTIEIRASHLADDILKKLTSCSYLEAISDLDLTCIWAHLGFVNIDQYVDEHFKDILPQN